MGGLRFHKVEGAGNDYVLVSVFDQAVDDPAALARAVSDRHRGVGSDGLLLVGPAEGADASMRIFNADGGEAEMCGNGLRCVVRWLAGNGLAAGTDVRVRTAAGVRVGRVTDRADETEVSMGRPDFAPEAVPVRGEGDPPTVALPADLAADPDVGFCVSVGNPHVVVRVADPDAVDLTLHGRAVETDACLPEGANVHFARVGADGAFVRPWERGSGATRACGSGAVAVAAVSRRLGWTDGDTFGVTMPGGRLAVRWDEAGVAWLAGPAHTPFSGEWSPS